jgi:thioredoxin reductase
LAAATAAARAGAKVRLFEEAPALGGQLRYRVQPVAASGEAESEQPRRIAHRLVADAVESGVEPRTNALVAGCFAPNELLVIAEGQGRRLTFDVLIVATGSTDLPFPFAGATFPGVFSCRGLQMLINQHRVLPGRRFAIVGAGPEAEELARDVLLAGGELMWRGITPAPFLAAHGRGGVTGFTVGQERFAVDVVAIAVGRQPDAALATMAGTPVAFAAALGGLVPAIDERLRSPTAPIWVAGDAAGSGSVAVAIAEGHLAGVAAAASLGLARDEEVHAGRAAGGAELERRMTMRQSLPPSFAQPYA